jgi:glucan phosphoethanolaminetransferase (alkaline phosphatase superfamily)
VRTTEKVVLTDFYIAFSPACFALLSLWLVVVTLNARAWVHGDEAHHWRGYGVALYFALPGTMSLLALIDPKDPRFWRVSFAVIALGGAAGMIALQAPFWARAGFLANVSFLKPIKSKQPMRYRERAMLVMAVVLYVLIGVLAIVSRSLLRQEAILLIILVFLGFNVAWLLLYDTSAARASNAGTASAVPGTSAHLLD